MQIIPFLQDSKWLSRRKIVSLIQNNQIFLNKEKIESFKSDLKNWDILTIIDEKWNNTNITVSEENKSLEMLGGIEDLLYFWRREKQSVCRFDIEK